MTPSARRAARRCTARSWQTEAPLRMLQNNLDPDVAERPDDLVVYGGTGRAARDWASFDALVRTLTTLGDDETLLVQSGRPVGVLRTHEWAPRVLIANSNLVGDWATWPEFRRLERLGLTMYGQMTAGSWIYIGTQGILQGTYETFAAVADKRFGGTPARHADRHRRVRRDGRRAAAGGDAQRRGVPGRRRVASGGCGGGWRPATSTSWRRLPRRRGRALSRARKARAARRCRSGSSATAPRCCPSCCAAASRSTSSPTRPRRTTRWPTCPTASTSTTGTTTPRTKPEEFTDRARESMARHVEAMVGFLDGGAEVFDYGNSIRDEARQGGYDRAFAFPGFVPAYIRPLFCAGKGPFRWAALSGDPADIAATDDAVLELFPDDDKLQRWIRAAREKVAFQGLPARICWLGHGERDRAGLRFNELVASGAISGADRDRPRPPRRRVGRLAVPGDRGDGRRLRRDRRLAAAQRAGQHRVGGDLGVDPPRRRGRHRPVDPRRAGDRWRTARRWPREKLARVLTNDPAMGVLRHVDAGYPEAEQAAEAGGLRVPMAEHGSLDACPIPLILRAGVAARWLCCTPIAAKPPCCGPGAHAEAAFDRMWADLAPARAAPRHRRLPPLRLDPGGRRPAGVVRRRGGRARAGPRRRPGRQPLGLVGRSRPRRPGRRPRLPPRLGARRRRLRRPARRRVRARRRRRAAGPRASSRPARSAVAVFGDEEGARFGVACAGSRLLTGALDARPGPRADRRRRREHGRGADPRRARPRRTSAATTRRCAGSATFVELHVEQGRALDQLDRAVAVGTGIWPHGRWRLDLPGEANHAGTTRARRPARPDARLRLRRARRPRRRGLARRAGHLREGRRRAERRQRDPVARSPPGSTPARPAPTRRGPSWRRSTGVVEVHGGTVTEESWTDRTAFDPPLGRPARARSLLGDRAAAARRAPGTTPASSRRPGCRRRCCSSATRPGSPTRPPSTPSAPTASPASRRSPTVAADLAATSPLPSPRP